MEKIRLLLSANKNWSQHYAEAVNAAGAEVFDKYLPDIDTSYDGLILTGGNDIDPLRYNEDINGAMDIDHERDKLEFSLLKAYIEAGKPVLGICRGHQFINVYFGGTLIQDLPEANLHTNFTDFNIIHPVEAEEASVAAKLYGTRFWVNTRHHQAVDKLGDGLRATAYWNQKYIEAIEHTSLPILGFQWHPEQMCANCRRDDTVDGIEIFKYFISMCKNRKVFGE